VIHEQSITSPNSLRPSGGTPRGLYRQNSGSHASIRLQGSSQNRSWTCWRWSTWWTGFNHKSLNFGHSPDICQERGSESCTFSCRFVTKAELDTLALGHLVGAPLLTCGCILNVFRTILLQVCHESGAGQAGAGAPGGHAAAARLHARLLPGQPPVPQGQGAA